MTPGELFWHTINLRSKLYDLSRRCSLEALEEAVTLLEANSILAWTHPDIDWSKTELGIENNDPTRFVPAEVLNPSVQKLRDKMARLQAKVAEKEALGEKIDLDD